MQEPRRRGNCGRRKAERAPSIHGWKVNRPFFFFDKFKVLLIYPSYMCTLLPPTHPHNVPVYTQATHTVPLFSIILVLNYADVRSIDSPANTRHSHFYVHRLFLCVWLKWKKMKVCFTRGILRFWHCHQKFLCLWIQAVEEERPPSTVKSQIFVRYLINFVLSYFWKCEI